MLLGEPTHNVISYKKHTNISYVLQSVNTAVWCYFEGVSSIRVAATREGTVSACVPRWLRTLSSATLTAFTSSGELKNYVVRNSPLVARLRQLLGKATSVLISIFDPVLFFRQSSSLLLFFKTL